MQGTISKLSEEVLASATTISPKKDFVYVSGSTQIETIRPPFGGFSGILVLVPKDGGIVLGTAGNVAVGATIAQNRSCLLVYSKARDKWYIGAIS